MEVNIIKDLKILGKKGEIKEENSYLYKNILIKNG